MVELELSNSQVFNLLYDLFEMKSCQSTEEGVFIYM